MKYILKKKIEDVPMHNIYVCDFCKKSTNVLYLYKLEDPQDQLRYGEDLVWFCNEDCLNCYILANK